LKKLYLVDGSGFIYRAFHALPPMKRNDGTPVGAVYGFCNMLLKMIDHPDRDGEKDALAVIFDAGRKTIRHEMYPEYKAHRSETPEDLIPQFSLIRDACKAFSVPSVELDRYEADDLIASYAEFAKQKGYEVIIVSSDKDLMQLVDDQVYMFDPLKNKNIKQAEVFEKFGVGPDKVIDAQALAGDASDNIPGVPGIGPKTAAELLLIYGDLETLLSRAGEIKQPKRRQTLLDNVENALLSKKLVTLIRDTPLPLSLKELEVKAIDYDFLNNFLLEQNFNSLAARLNKRGQQSAVQDKNYKTILSIDELKLWIQSAKDLGLIVIDCETTSLQAVQAELVGVALALSPRPGQIHACYVPLAHLNCEGQIDRQEALELLKPMLMDPSVLKVGHNVKYDLVVLQKYGIEAKSIDDTMLMSYVLNAGKHGHGMDELAERYLGHTTIKFKEVAGIGKSQVTFDHVDVKKATDYAAEDAEITMKLYQLLNDRITAEQRAVVYYRLERPLVPVIVQMECNGILVDRPLLESLGTEYTARLLILEEEIYKLAGRPFNIASPKQLGDILFVEMSLPAPKKTKTGAFVTDVDVLEKLALLGHELPAKIIEWRTIAKLKSTYVDGLVSAINPNTNRVHTSFSMAGAATGRLSSSEPNLQNIPIRTEEGRKIRQAFIAEEDCQLVSLDYSQIELRLLAHIAQVHPLIEAFRNGDDIHAATASQIFSVPLEQMTSDLRRQAKAINFGIIYGISSFGLAQQLGIPNGEAGEIIKRYFQKYPGIEAYMQKYRTMARDKGYVETLFKRRCYTPGINDTNGMTRQFAERQAINAPLQGSNADIIKRAMIRMPALLVEANSKARLVLQVHDELLFEIPETEIATLVPVLKKTMETVVSLSVPLVVGIGIGKNWDQAH
jgi:DNA polymerase-1